MLHINAEIFSFSSYKPGDNEKILVIRRKIVYI